MIFERLTDKKFLMEAIEFLKKSDPKLAEVIELLPLPEYESTEDIFSDLVWLMIEHQVPCRARGHWVKKVYDMVGEDFLVPDLMFNLDEQEWANKKLAAKKLHNVRNLAERWQKEDLYNFDWENTSDEDIREILISFNGIAEHSANMILLFTLQRPDIFLPDDSHIKQVMPLLYDIDPKLKLKKNMLEISSRWEGQRSLATKYLIDYRAWRKKQ